MRFIGTYWIVILASSLLLAQPPASWTTGFWFWEGSKTRLGLPPSPVDVIYFQSTIHNAFPRDLPPANQYCVVLRYEVSDLSSPPAPRELPEWFQRMRQGAKIAGKNLVGLQLDIDYPTNRLDEYAKLLATYKKALGPQAQLSITALPDWFRPGTAIRDVIAAVDEFVPQFYDLGPQRTVLSHPVIAHPLEAQRWAPVFSKFGKRFRIGISTFGRAVSRHATYASEASRFTMAALVGHPGLSRDEGRTPARELWFRFTAQREIERHPFWLSKGDRIEVVLATPDSVQLAVAEIRKMGPLCAGVLFFRWPSFAETLAMLPDEVLAAANATPFKPYTRLEVRQGDCATVHCVDLYFVAAVPLQPSPLRYRIQSSQPMEYFLPGDDSPARMANDASAIEVILPPYSSRAWLLLGRAVTAKPAEYQLDSAQ